MDREGTVPIHSSPHSIGSLHARALAPKKKEFGPNANNHEAGSSRQIASAAFSMAPPTVESDRIYVTVVAAQMFWSTSPTDGT
jgi:hypothetical protein